jgi:predicted SAM-dependent methyltransferase
MKKKVKTSQKLKLVEAVTLPPLKLDLGCGQNPKEGFEGVDLYGDKAIHKVDLFKFPWRFKDSSVDEIHASHLLEHIPAREVENRDLVDPITAGRGLENRAGTQYLGADMLFAFMDECWRIMKPDTWMHIVVPSGRSNRAFWDPTHRRFFMQETFLYFNRDWRKQNGLDHYRVSCHFGVEVGFSLPNEEALLSDAARMQRFHNMWNVTCDWIAKAKKNPL